MTRSKSLVRRATVGHSLQVELATRLGRQPIWAVFNAEGHLLQDRLSHGAACRLMKERAAAGRYSLLVLRVAEIFGN